MSVIRIQKTENYVILSKEALEDPNLSFKAKGLWAYCLSRPNNWEFHVTHLATVSKEKESAIYSALKELISSGYCERIQHSDGKRFTKLEYIMYESSKLKKCLPLRGFPDAENPDLENSALLSIEEETKNIKENKDRHAAKGGSSPRKSKIEKKEEKADRVFITPSQHESLLKKLNNHQLKVKCCYEKLSNWKIGNQIEGGNDYACITKWVIGAVEKEWIEIPLKGGEWSGGGKMELPPMNRKERNPIAAWVDDHPKRALLQRLGKLVVNSSCVEFPDLPESKIYYTDNGFKERFDNFVRKSTPTPKLEDVLVK